MSARTITRRGGLGEWERAFLEQVVVAGLANRHHAMQVLERNERLVIEAWKRALDPGVELRENGATEADIRQVNRELEQLWMEGMQ